MATNASMLYSECMEAANTLARRAHQLAENPDAEGELSEFASLQARNFAAAALSLIQAAVTIHKASSDAKHHR